MDAMESSAYEFDRTLPGIDRRVSTIERERKAEQVAREMSEAATKEDIGRLESRFNALIKAVWTVAGILATIGGSILANHI